MRLAFLRSSYSGTSLLILTNHSCRGRSSHTDTRRGFSSASQVPRQPTAKTAHLPSKEFNHKGRDDEAHRTAVRIFPPYITSTRTCFCAPYDILQPVILHSYCRIVRQATSYLETESELPK